MFLFSTVKKIGEGSYLIDDHFIIERVRKERALNIRRAKIDNTKYANRIFTRERRSRPS